MSKKHSNDSQLSLVLEAPPVIRRNEKTGASVSSVSRKPGTKVVSATRSKRIPRREINKVTIDSKPHKRQAEDDDHSFQEDYPLPMHCHPTGSFSFPIRQRYRRDHALLATPDVPARTVGSALDHVRPIMRCQCGRTAKCLKFQCDCFATGVACTDACNCNTNCCNNQSPENALTRTKVVVGAVQRDPDSFRYRCSQIASQHLPHFWPDMGEAHFVKMPGNFAAQLTGVIPSTSPSLVGGSQGLTSRLTHSALRADGATSVTGEQKTEMDLGISKNEESLINLATSISVAKSRREEPTPVAKELASTKDMTGSNVPFCDPRQFLPSFYAVPVKLNGSVQPGLSYNVARPDTSTRRSKSKQHRIHHDLMLSPSKVISPKDAGTAVQQTLQAGRIQTDVKLTTSSQGQAPHHQLRTEAYHETSLQKRWGEATDQLKLIFAAMDTELEKSSALGDRPKKGAGKEAAPIPDHAEGCASEVKCDAVPNEIAHDVLHSLQEDIKQIHKVALTAELNVKARLYSGKKLSNFSRSHQSKDRDDEDSSAEEEPDSKRWRCTERMPMWGAQERGRNFPDQMITELTIVAARDAAMLSEAARIIRSKSRELSQKRLVK